VLVMLVANSLALASLYILVASGLALIYGLRDVLNFGHGAIYMVGAYLGFTLGAQIGFWAAVVVVPTIMGVVGIALELLVLRPLSRRSHIEVALVTFGIGLVLGQAIVWIYGGFPRSLTAPEALSGSVSLFGITYPAYRIFLILVGLGSVAGLSVWLRCSRTGLFVRAVSQNPMISSMMGINAGKLSLLVTCLSTAFAGFAGVLVGPYISIDPGMDIAMIINCMIIVVIGGAGSLFGAIVASLLFGFIQVAGAIFLPGAAVLLPYALLIAILIWRPQGLGHGRVT
jgi:branched-chain amino acid transport system permease protein